MRLSPCPSLDVCLYLPLFVYQQELKDYPVYPDPSLKAFEGATLRYASLNLKYSLPHTALFFSPPTKFVSFVCTVAHHYSTSSQLDSYY